MQRLTIRLYEGQHDDLIGALRRRQKHGETLNQAAISLMRAGNQHDPRIDEILDILRRGPVSVTLGDPEPEASVAGLDAMLTSFR